MNKYPTSPRRLPAFLAGVALLACALGALALPSVAMASKCGNQVLLDWSDNGRIDRVYPLHCYEDAIDSIPADLLDYADAEDVISRALAEAQNGGGTGDGTGGSGDPERPIGTPGSPTTSGSGSEVAPAADGSDPSSIPIPLLLFALMSLALLGAGGLGYLSRRRNGGGDGLGDDELPGA